MDLMELLRTLGRTARTHPLHVIAGTIPAGITLASKAHRDLLASAIDCTKGGQRCRLHRYED